RIALNTSALAAFMERLKTSSRVTPFALIATAMISQTVAKRPVEFGGDILASERVCFQAAAAGREAASAQPRRLVRLSPRRRGWSAHRRWSILHDADASVCPPERDAPGRFAPPAPPHHHRRSIRHRGRNRVGRDRNALPGRREKAPPAGGGRECPATVRL